MCNSIGALKDITRAYHERIGKLEDLKYDLEYIVKSKDFQVHKKNYKKMIHI